MISLHQPLHLVLDPDATRPLCAVVLMVDGGAASDALPGLTHLTLQWWVQRSLQHLPVQLDWRVEGEFSYLGMICQPLHLKRVLEGLGLSLLHLLQPPESLTEGLALQQQLLRQVQQDSQHPDRQLLQHLRQRFLGPGPGNPLRGTVEGLQAITPADVWQHQLTFAQSTRLILAVGGDFDPAMVIEAVDGPWCQLPAGEAKPMLPNPCMADVLQLSHAGWQGFAVVAHPPGHDHSTLDRLVGHLLWECAPSPVRLAWKGGRHRWGAFGLHPVAHAGSLQAHTEQLAKGIPAGWLDQGVRTLHTRLLLRQSSLLAHVCGLATTLYFSHSPPSIDQEMQQLRDLSCCQVHARMVQFMEQLQTAQRF